MSCPLCRQRKARRACPALGQTICAVCCGTKRLVEIACPADCPYLTTAREHPPAAVQKQRDRDKRFLASLMSGLSDVQSQLVLLLHLAIERYRPGAIPALIDDDVAEATGTLASTYETAARGIIYEHRSQSLPAERLAANLKSTINETGRAARPPHESDLSTALRRIELAARQARKVLEGRDTSYLDCMQRLLAEFRTESAASPDANEGATAEGFTRSGLILP